MILAANGCIRWNTQRHTSDMCTRAAELMVLRRLWFSFFTASSCACSSACLATLSAFRIWAAAQHGQRQLQHSSRPCHVNSAGEAPQTSKHIDCSSPAAPQPSVSNAPHPPPTAPAYPHARTTCPPAQAFFQSPPRTAPPPPALDLVSATRAHLVAPSAREVPPAMPPA